MVAASDMHTRTVGVKPENIVWILGGSRGGSTWLMRMMANLPEHQAWDEPISEKSLKVFLGRINQPKFYSEKPVARSLVRMHKELRPGYSPPRQARLHHPRLPGDQRTQRLDWRTLADGSPSGEPDDLLGPRPKGRGGFLPSS
jgi:hypothetical protein